MFPHDRAPVTPNRIAATKRLIRPHIRRTPVLEMEGADLGLGPFRYDAIERVEVRLLSPFFETPEAIIARHTLAGRLETEIRTIDLLVHRLLRKVEADAGEVLPLRSMRNRGYVFAAPVES